MSSLLFVIVMEVLNALILEVDRHELLSALPENAIKHRTLLYTDDLHYCIMICSNSFFFLKGRLNIEPPHMVPI